MIFQFYCISAFDPIAHTETLSTHQNVISTQSWMAQNIWTLYFTYLSFGIFVSSILVHKFLRSSAGELFVRSMHRASLNSLQWFSKRYSIWLAVYPTRLAMILSSMRDRGFHKMKTLQSFLIRLGKSKND